MTTGKLGLLVIGILLFWPFEEAADVVLEYDADMADDQDAVDVDVDSNDDGDSA